MGAEAPRRVRDVPHDTRNDARGQNVRVSFAAPRFERSPARDDLPTGRVFGIRDADTNARVPTRPLLTSTRSSAGERILPLAHATFAWEKRAFTRAGRRDGGEDAVRGARREDVSDRDIDAIPSTSRDGFVARAAFRRYAAPDGRLAPGRVVLALGDLGVFEDDADSCDCEAIGRLVAERVGFVQSVSFARFATTAAVLETRRRERKKNALGVPGSGPGAPALVPPELFRNQTLRRVFMRRAGRVATSLDAKQDRGGASGCETRVDVEDVDAFRLSASQFVFWLRDAGALRDGLTEAGALVLFARARGTESRRDSDPDEHEPPDEHEHDGTTCRLCDVALRFAPDFVAALALAATARGETAEAVAGALVMDAASPTVPSGTESVPSPLAVHASRLRRLRACFAMLDETRAGFVRNDRLASVLAAGDAFTFSGAPRGGDLDAAAAFLHARVHERAPELGFVSTRDARDGHVSLRECEAHFLAAARSGFVPDFRAAETNDARLPKTTFSEDDFFFGVETRDASTTFERFCAAGREAGFAAEPHPRLMDLERFERFALEARLYDSKLADGAARVAFAAAARGAVRVDVSGFFAAVAAVARHKALSPADAVERVKRARLSGLATVGVGGNDERARRATSRGGGCRTRAGGFRKRREER